MTADAFDSNFVYAIWVRCRFPSDVREHRSLAGAPRSFRSDATFTRTTDGVGAVALLEDRRSDLEVGAR
jgi:hypothetical protein